MAHNKWLAYVIGIVVCGILVMWNRHCIIKAEKEAEAAKKA